MIEIAPINDDKKETIKPKSQCHSLSRKSLHKTAPEKILENSVFIDTVADSGTTRHFFPNKKQ